VRLTAPALVAGLFVVVARSASPTFQLHFAVPESGFVANFLHRPGERA
jgi:hypothetical protein